MKKIIYSDLDGTLFSYSSEGKSFINDSNSASIKQWLKHNHFGIATGRNILGLLDRFEVLETLTNLPYVLLNGSVIYDYKTDTILYQDIMNKDVIDECVLYATNNKQYQMFLITPTKRYSIFEYDSKIAHEYVSLEDLPYHEISKITFLIKKEAYDTVVNEINNFKNYEKLELAPSNLTYIELVNKNTNKHEGIKKALELSNIKDYQLSAIGDHLNDFEMLSGADLAFAPENALNKIKEAADYIVSSNNDSPITEMINLINMN